MINIDKTVEEKGREELFGLVVDDLFENVCRDLEPFASYSQRMSEGEKMVMLIWSLSCEVANGGVSQFLSNDSGDYFCETRDYLLRIGASVQVAAFDRVSDEIFGGVVPKDRDRRCHLLWAFSGELDDDPDWERKESKAEEFFDNIDESFGWCETVKEKATDFIIRNQEEFNRGEP